MSNNRVLNKGGFNQSLIRAENRDSTEKNNEKELKAALLANVEKFLMELGNELALRDGKALHKRARAVMEKV